MKTRLTQAEQQVLQAKRWPVTFGAKFGQKKAHRPLARNLARRAAEKKGKDYGSKLRKGPAVVGSREEQEKEGSLPVQKDQRGENAAYRA